MGKYSWMNRSKKSSITKSRKTAQSVLSDAELSPANEKTLTDFLYDDGGY